MSSTEYMTIEELHELRTLVEKYISLLHEEASAIAKLLSFFRNPSPKMIAQTKRYREREQQIRVMLDDSDVLLKWIDAMVSEQIYADGPLIGNLFSRKNECNHDGVTASASDDYLETKKVLDEAYEQARAIADSISDADLHLPDYSAADLQQSDEELEWLSASLYEDEKVQVNVNDVLELPLESEQYDEFVQTGEEDSAEVSDAYFGNSENSEPEGVYGRCRICGTLFHQAASYCPMCGTKVKIEKPVVVLDRVHFSAVAPKTFVRGNYTIIEIIMYEDGFRRVVDEAISNADKPVKETRSGRLSVERKAKITVVLSSPDIVINDDTEVQIWEGEYLDFSFAVELPEQYEKKQILFVAEVYINDVIATRLKFIAQCESFAEQKIEIERIDIRSAFISYASQDRKRVAMIIQGMKKARPDMDLFFDVESLRSGDDWERALMHEIDQRDVLYLCWSKYASQSKWVNAEWRYAFNQKGIDSIEPVPIDPPGICPPPEELGRKHFNDRLLYIINSDMSESPDESKASSSNESVTGLDYF